MTDYYQVLGITKNASDAEIKKAYRARARELHPDLHPDDPKAKEKFQELQEAFDILNNTEKRAVYDRYGVNPDRMGQGASGPGGFQWSGGGKSFAEFFRNSRGGGAGGASVDGMPEDLASLFGGMFGGTPRGRKATQRRGEDITQEVAIPLSLAVRGGEVEVTLARQSGKKTVSVKIPAGVENGKKIRLRGQGEAFGTGQAGDAILLVRIAPHPHFRRIGNDLYLKLPVTFREAALGAKIEIPSPQGEVTLKIPAGSSTGTKLRLTGHGVTAKGNLIAELEVILPQKWTNADLTAIHNFTTPDPIINRSQLW